MNIRPVNESDSADWGRMREALWPSGTGKHAAQIRGYFAGWLKEPLEVLIALDEKNNAVGFIELSIRAYAPGCSTDNVAFVEGWYVDPAARRTGVGAALVNAAGTWARKKGCTELASDTEIENVLSAKAHLAAGFSETGIIRCFKKTL